MADQVESLLEYFGPSTTSKIAALLADRAKISPNAARQRISRAGGNVRKLAGIPFPRNARFMYLEKQFGSPIYWSNLADSLMESNSAHGFAIAALRQAGGIIPARQFPIVCGAPVKQKKHLSPTTIAQRLSEAGLVQSIIIPALGECFALVQEDGHYDWHSAEMRARIATEEILIFAVRDWLRKLGIASYNLVATRSDNTLPSVGTFAWDLSAPSYLGHMVRYGKDGKSKPGFVACDVSLTDRMTLAGVAPFIRKCSTLRALRNVGPCMQILVAGRFDNDAFRLLRKNGIIAATPASLFGDEIAEALHEMISVLTNAARSLYDTEKIEQLIASLSKIEGAAYQLRGTLFEYMVADAVKRNANCNVWMNRVLKAPDKKQAEVDILAVSDNHSITAIECKGYSPRATIPDELFKRWLHHNVPTAYKSICQHTDWKNLPVTFEFWTTAPISAEALALFSKAKNEIKQSRYSITLRGPKEVFRACHSTNEMSLITALEKHFMLPDGSIPPDARPPRTDLTAINQGGQPKQMSSGNLP